MGTEEMEEIIKSLKKENKRLRSSLMKIANTMSEKGIERIAQTEKYIRERTDAYPYAAGACQSEALYGLYGDEYLLSNPGEREKFWKRVEEESEGLHEKKEEKRRDFD